MSYLGRETSFLGYVYSATFLAHDSTLHLSFSLFVLFFLALLAKSSLFSLFCKPFFVGAYLKTYFTSLT